MRSGSYHPSTLITSEVPKPSGMTRPGSILRPLDRMLYQAIADYVAPVVDSQLDATRVFSYRTLNPDPDFQMFQPRSEGYQRFKEETNQMALGTEYKFAISADIASYFVHLNHHSLENLLIDSGIEKSVRNVLVNHMLQSWSGRFSYGIPQGLFPSDLLGNFYLSSLDTFLTSANIYSLRYVDDLVLFFRSRKEALAAVAPTCRFLRGIGLDFNECKTTVLGSEALVREQTDIDRLFETARTEVANQVEYTSVDMGYGFQDPWEVTLGDLLEPKDLDLLALKELWDRRTDVEVARRDQLDVFCLGLFGRAGSDAAVEVVLRELGNRPHLTRAYCQYVAPLIRRNPEIKQFLCNYIEEESQIYDWELQWPIVALMGAEDIPSSTINRCLTILTQKRISNEVRALCAILAAKFGAGAIRTNLRNHWDSEDSDHVKAAMVLSCSFFAKDLRDILLPYWAKQSPLNDLVARAVRKQLSLSN